MKDIKDKIIRFLKDKEPMNQNQGLQLAKAFPDIKKDILKMKPGPHPGLRQFFLDAVKTETDPKVLHTIGIRDLPKSIRYAVMDNSKTEDKTIEKMASQNNNNAVQDRAKKVLDARKAEREAAGDMMESKFKLSTKDIKKIIREELQRLI